MMAHINPRAMIAAATIAVLLGLWMDRPIPPIPVQHVQVDYCWQDIYASANISGVWVKLWTKGYSPCSQMDRYENI